MCLIILNRARGYIEHICFSQEEADNILLALGENRETVVIKKVETIREMKVAMEEVSDAAIEIAECLSHATAVNMNNPMVREFMNVSKETE